MELARDAGITFRKIRHGDSPCYDPECRLREDDVVWAPDDRWNSQAMRHMENLALRLGFVIEDDSYPDGRIRRLPDVDKYTQKISRKLFEKAGLLTVKRPKKK